MVNCAIATCKNYNKKTKDREVEIVYHKFPREHNLAQSWAIKCKREDKINFNTASICSEHFSVEDYQDDMKN